MKVILLQDVKSLGKKGEVVEVSDGYAKNFLFTKKLGIEANGKNMNDLKLQKANDEKIALQNLQDAKDLAELIATKTVVVKLKSGEGGRTFGSISSKEIAQELKSQHKIDIDKKKISIQDNIKNFVTYPVVIKLFSEITANISVIISE